MNVIQMIERLREHGFTETRIAEELGISSSSVGKIRRGIIKNPLHSTVRGIELLYQIVLLQKSNLNNLHLPIKDQVNHLKERGL